MRTGRNRPSLAQTDPRKKTAQGAALQHRFVRQIIVNFLRLSYARLLKQLFTQYQVPRLKDPYLAGYFTGLDECRFTAHPTQK